jgi:hypothetical protein
VQTDNQVGRTAVGAGRVTGDRPRSGRATNRVAADAWRPVSGVRGPGTAPGTADPAVEAARHDQVDRPAEAIDLTMRGTARRLRNVTTRWSGVPTRVSEGTRRKRPAPTSRQKV